jgi:hypothetical protein
MLLLGQHALLSLSLINTNYIGIMQDKFFSFSMLIIAPDKTVKQ